MTRPADLMYERQHEKLEKIVIVDVCLQKGLVIRAKNLGFRV